MSHPGEHKVFPSLRSPSGLRKSMLDAICESGNSRSLKNLGQGACSRGCTRLQESHIWNWGQSPDAHENLSLAW